MESVRETPSLDHSQKSVRLQASNGSADPESTPTSPPYWQYHRSVSHASVDSTARPPPISLEDHTEAHSDTSGALWARDITVEDYVIVRGGSTGIGAYVVWNCKVQTINVGARNDSAQIDSLLTCLGQGRSADHSKEVGHFHSYRETDTYP
jgi:hypothetical protein